MHIEFNSYLITDAPNSSSSTAVKGLLDGSYWASDRDPQDIQQAIQHSLPIYVLHQETLIGFARVVTDHIYFAWIADVIVHPGYRGQGIGKAIVSFIQNHPEIPTHLQVLRTKDAQGLYHKFGFVESDRFMCTERKSS